MKPDKHFLAALGVLIAAAGLIALTWVGTMELIRAERADTLKRATASVDNQARAFAEQINRQILGIDQTLRILVAAWEANPRGFNLEASRARSVVLDGISRDMVLTDENGIIRQSSVVEAITQNASALDYFRALSAPSETGDQLYIGPAAIDEIMRQWHMNAARPLHYPDGSFAGLIDADYRITAITDIFAEANIGTNIFVGLIGLDDGKVRAAVGATSIDPNANISDTPMFHAIQGAASGTWTGPSANDAVQRIHAFRQIPGHRLAVVVGISSDEAMLPATEWQTQAELFAGGITVLLTALALLVINGAGRARRRAAAVAEDRAVLAASNAQLEVARALTAAKAEQLEATLAGMSDGVSMVDGHLCLAEWNARFPEVAGVPAEILRIGLPMEEILRAQIQTGQFGWVADPETEIERRMARLRAAPFGVVQRQRPDGRTLELRRNRLPDGGFVTLYSDVTEHKRAEEALRQARAAAEAANADKSRFVAIVSHEIRTPLNALLNAIRLLAGSVLAPAQQSLLAMARQSGDVLFGLIGDILDMSQMEAGKLAIRPSLFELRPLLEGCVEMFASQAADRGINLRLFIAENTPPTLLTDPGRLRQVQLNLLSNAVKYASPGEVWLIVEPGSSAQEAVRLTVRDNGPVIAPEARERLFRPFARLDRPAGEESSGTGLGLAICHHLVSLMGGAIGCDPWESADGLAGNAFWVALPTATLPYRDQADLVPTALASMFESGAPPTMLPSRPPPRTRILLTEDIPANQVVTAMLLRRQGHHVDIATTGPEAIKAIQAAPYDIVFMDIFMPGMGGPEATQIIRELPEPACSTPIVALTGSVGPEDEAVFKAAGMDGVLAKPVSPTEIQDTLHRYVWSAQPAAPGPAGPDGSAAAPDPAAAVLSMERINELRSNMSPAIFADLIEECLLDMEHRLPALRRALASGVPGAITAHAHSLVGMAAGYGMVAFERRLRQVMNAVREADLTPLRPPFTADLQHDYEAAVANLRALLKTEMA